MALENKKLSSYDDLASANIDTTTKLVVLTGATKVNSNLPVVNFIEDTLTSTSVVKPLSAKQGKVLQDTKAPIANPTFTGAVNGITKSMVGLSNVDNTSDANKPISTAQAAGLAPKANPTFTGIMTAGDVKFNVGENLAAFVVENPNVILFKVDGDSQNVQIYSPIISNLQTFADNAAAAAIATGTVYKTPAGVLMIKY